jgi:hypothetical protein
MAQSEIEAIRTLLSSKPRPVGWLERRKHLDEVGSIWSVAADVKLTSVDVDGVAGEWSIVPGSDSSRVLIFFHGGGYCSGSIMSHRRLVTEAGRAAGYCLSTRARAPVPSSVRRCANGVAFCARPEYSCCTHWRWWRQRWRRPHSRAD